MNDTIQFADGKEVKLNFDNVSEILEEEAQPRPEDKEIEVKTQDELVNLFTQIARIEIGNFAQDIQPVVMHNNILLQAFIRLLIDKGLIKDEEVQNYFSREIQNRQKAMQNAQEK
ncbi:MAG: hypothetical protein ACP6IQ_02110 [Candidatus Njordarchaeia archaeon]